jgi:presenilin 1
MYYKETAVSPAQRSLEALCNALLVIAFVAALTFGLVLLYKFDGMKLFLGYCVLYSAALLGVVGAKLVVLALAASVIMDQFAFALIMYNFAAVGVLAIFYQKGIPPAVERGYLVATSVIVAWQLAQLPQVRARTHSSSRFDTLTRWLEQWSVWMLLFLLAFWDLFAVLTPMGPLRWLVDLVQEKGTPIPGLLFQADVADAHSHKARDDRPAARNDAEMAEYVQQCHAKLSATPEDTFFQRLLTAGTGGEPATAKEVEQLTWQLRAFLRDQRSHFESRAGDLSRMFTSDSSRLWRNLYAYYNVSFVPPSRPYPPLHQVFPPEFVTGTGEETAASEHEGDDKSIKLGLGDFIFYSVLVARAAEESFAAFSACFVAVLAVRRIASCFLGRTMRLTRVTWLRCRVWLSRCTCWPRWTRCQRCRSPSSRASQSTCSQPRQPHP